MPCGPVWSSRYTRSPELSPSLTCVVPPADNPSVTARFPVRAIDQEEVEAGLARAMWLGRDPEAGTELTVAEARAGGIAGGPRGGCDAPAEGSPEAGGLAPEASDPAAAVG